MPTPFCGRPLTADERATLETGLRSLSAVTGRRCPRRLARAAGPRTTPLARQRRCPAQTVRQAMPAGHQRGLAGLQPRSSRPHPRSTSFDAGACESLRALWHQRPRPVGQPTRRWTLPLAAEVSFAQDLTPRLVSDDTLCRARRRWGVSWRRAQPWRTRPAPAEARQKTRRDRLLQRAMAPPTGALGCRAEVWWSRLAQPAPQGGTEAAATPTWPDRTPPPDPRGLRGVAGPPVRAVTIALLAWCSAPLAAQGCTAWLLSWNHASWPRRQAVRHGIRPHQPQVKRGAVGVRRVVCRWPSTRPWLHPIEPTGVPGQRAVSEADRRLRADALEARV
jgi:hypothetical protein